MKHWTYKSLTALLCLSLTLPTAKVLAEEFQNKDRDRILEIFNLITESHVNPKPADELADGAIWGMLSTLADPHTVYFSDQDFAAFTASLEGTFTGIGVALGQDQDGAIIIHQVYEHSQAKRVGLQPGDQLMEIDGQGVLNEPLSSVINRLKGEEGTKVRLRFLSKDRLYSVELTREKIEVPVVQSTMLEEGIAYIQLSSFSVGAVDKFRATLHKYKNDGAKAFIIDLRDNPGGLLDSAVDMVSLFIREGPVVYAKNRAGEEKVFGVKRGESFNLPLVVLVNEYTASAAEIVASALKEYGKAKVIGTPTFGKGTVQQIIPLKAGGYLKLTMEEYFTAMHNPMDGRGVIPNILVGDREEQMEAAKYALQAGNRLSLLSTQEVSINGKPDQGKTPAAIYEKGAWYVSPRKLAYLFGGELFYSAEERRVRLKIGEHGADWYLDDERAVVVRKGTAYVELNQLLAKHPQIKKVVQDQDIVLQGKS